MSDVKDAFDEHNIDIPYPQRVVHVQHVKAASVESDMALHSETKNLKS